MYEVNLGHNITGLKATLSLTVTLSLTYCEKYTPMICDMKWRK